MKLRLKLALATERNVEFCGAGLLQLLAGIERHGSIRRAAEEMRLSYVKALRILNRLERELGATFLIRHKGGAARGHTELTPGARRFLRDFTRARVRVQRAADQAFSGFCARYGRKPQRSRA